VPVTKEITIDDFIAAGVNHKKLCSTIIPFFKYKDSWMTLNCYSELDKKTIDRMNKADIVFVCSHPTLFRYGIIDTQLKATVISKFEEFYNKEI
jgi:hypothetical protein